MSRLVETSLQSISNEFKQFKDYKENYDVILSLPIVRKLIKQNKSYESNPRTNPRKLE